MPVSSKYSKIAAAQQAEKTKTAAGEGDGVRYNLKNTTDKNVVSIKQQIENVAQELNAADPVARKTVFNIFGSMNIKQKRAWAEAEALKYGNRVDRQEYGSIEVSRTSKVSIPADGENVRQQFSLKAPVEEKNLLALHNLTEKNLLGRQRTPSFNPRPPRGGRLERPRTILKDKDFNPRPPARGATPAGQERSANHPYFNPRPPRGGRPLFFRVFHIKRYFNPRPREGGRLRAPAIQSVQQTLFQSTPPARGATGCRRLQTVQKHISIHAPREGGDECCEDTLNAWCKFQSTPPARGATWTRMGAALDRNISIHAPREGGDLDSDGCRAGS